VKIALEIIREKRQEFIRKWDEWFDERERGSFR
jgi:hypothetical protein